MLSTSIPINFKEIFKPTIEKVAFHRVTRVALFALSWTAGIALTASFALSPALLVANVVLISAIGLGVWVVCNRILQDDQNSQLQKIVNVAMITIGLTVGVLTGNIIAAGFITTAVAALAFANLNLTYGIGSVFVGSITLGYGLPVAKMLYTYTFKALRGVWNSGDQLREMRPYGWAGLASIREVREWATVLHNHLPNKLKVPFWTSACLSMEDKELESFLLSHKSMEIHIPSIWEELRRLDRVDHLQNFYQECATRANEIGRFCAVVELSIPTNADEIEALTVQLNQHASDARRLISLFNYYPDDTYSETAEHLGICYNKWLINDNNNELRAKLRTTRNRPGSDEDPNDPTCAVLSHLFTDDACQKYIEKLQFPRLSASPIQTIQSELEKRNLGTRGELESKGLLPLRGTFEDQESTLLHLLLSEPFVEEKRTSLIQTITGVLDGQRPNQIATSKKVVRTIKITFFEVSIWTARLMAMTTQTIPFCVGMAFALTRTVPHYHIDSFVPNSCSFANCDGFFEHFQQYAQGIAANSFGLTSGYLTGRRLVRLGRRLTRPTQTQRKQEPIA